MTTRRKHLERAILLVAQATQEIAHSPSCDAVDGEERERLVAQLEAIVRRLRDVLEGDIG